MFPLNVDLSGLPKLPLFSMAGSWTVEGARYIVGILAILNTI
jgi:hypothetical protein